MYLIVRALVIQRRITSRNKGLCDVSFPISRSRMFLVLLPFVLFYLVYIVNAVYFVWRSASKPSTFTVWPHHICFRLLFQYMRVPCRKACIIGGHLKLFKMLDDDRVVFSRFWEWILSRTFDTQTFCTYSKLRNRFPARTISIIQIINNYIARIKV